MNKLLHISSLLVLFCVISIPAHADDGIPIAFEDLDTDVSGHISRDESNARQDIVKNWKKIDKNQDDQLDVNEYAAYEGKNRFSPPEDSEIPELGAAPLP
ncbi:MAG: hypothetical protein GXP60_06330 [Epsilonproteobacteria bacterium]|nr:hypothetical protein [Campylobacterota bacterium]